MDSTLGLKLPVGDVSAKATMTIKKLTGLSLAEIKLRAKSDQFIVLCDFTDDDGLELINKLKRELKKLGIEARLFEDQYEETSESFDNLEALHHAIDANEVPWD